LWPQCALDVGMMDEIDVDENETSPHWHVPLFRVSRPRPLLLRDGDSSSLSPRMRDAIFPSTSASSSSRAATSWNAYCGAGPFALTLAPHFL
jgi:hypothetical protein